MGRMLGQMPDLDPRFWEIPDRLRDARARLDDLEARVRANPEVAREIGRDVVHAEMRYGDLVSEYQRLHTMILGEPATGLGIVPAAVAGFVLIIIGAVWKYLEFLDALDARAERREKAARRERAGLPPQDDAPPDWTTWLSDHWQLVAVGLAIILAPSILGGALRR